MRYIIVILFFAAVTLSSCGKDEPTPCEHGGTQVQNEQNS